MAQVGAEEPNCRGYEPVFYIPGERDILFHPSTNSNFRKKNKISSLKCYNLTQHPLKKNGHLSCTCLLKNHPYFFTPAKQTRERSSNSCSIYFFFQTKNTCAPQKKPGDLRFDASSSSFVPVSFGSHTVRKRRRTTWQVLARLLVSKIMLPRRRNRWPSMQWPRFLGRIKNAHDVVT